MTGVSSTSSAVATPLTAGQNGSIFSAAYPHGLNGGSGDAARAANGSGSLATTNASAAAGASSGAAPSAGGSAAASTTESVIEELKALAKSMLEATNAARRRTSSLEQRNSYEALMHAIETRVHGGEGNSTNMNSLNSSSQARDAGNANAASAITAGGTSAPPSLANKYADPMAGTDLIEQLTDIPAALSAGSADGSPKLAQPSASSGLAARRVSGKDDGKTLAGAAARAAAAASQPAAPRAHAADDSDDENDGDDEDDVAGSTGEGGHLAARLQSTAPVTRARNAPPVTLAADEDDMEDEPDDDDGTSYDGVKTQVLFKPVNRTAYREVVASTWKPEGLTRRIAGGSGSTRSDRRQRGSGAGDHSGSSSGGSPDQDADSDADVDSDDDDEVVASVQTRNKTARAAAQSSSSSSLKVYRVPSFPYGGGVTEQQARLLQRQFDACIHSGEHLSSNAAGPALVTRRDFDAGAYDEIDAATTQTDTSTFQPTSPYEFVVEVEREVRFDAVKAREERRRLFRQLVREKRAPATMGTFNLRVIMDPFKTGFEEEKNFPIVAGTVIAGRYEIIQMLGKATFSRAVRCYDLHEPIYEDEDGNATSEATAAGQDDEDDDNDEDDDGDEHQHGNDSSTGASPAQRRSAGGSGSGEEGSGAASAGHNGHPTSSGSSAGKGGESAAGAAARGSGKSKQRRKRKLLGYGQVCLKIINNTKDFFDQALDEIRLLTLLNRQKDPDEAHVVRLIDAFYYKEHVMLVTELLRDTLYDYGKYNREEEEEFYFTVPRLRRLTRQIVEALTYVHSLNLIHTDLKPENIMFVSYSRCIVKVIDFGSSCFLSDHLSSYIQSRSYRAPEVVLGCDYDGRIDIWSLGAILVEMVTGDVLFTSDTVPEMLARIVYVCGTPFPRRMLWEGRHTSDFINKFGCIYEYGGTGGADGPPQPRDRGDRGGDGDNGEEPYCLYTPVPTMAPHTCASSRKSRAAATSLPPPRVSTAPYSVLREKLAAANMVDEEFISFVEACLTLDHKQRPTSAQLLDHPFIKDVLI